MGRRKQTASEQGAPPGDWWRSYFDGEYLREFGRWMDPVEDRVQVARLLDVLALPSGSRVLDLACGQGRHAHLLAEAGFDVTGLDFSKELLRRAKARGTGKTLRYVRGDMRRLPLRWRRRFDAVVNLFTSFGFFDDPADDAAVLAGVSRVLKRGGVFVFHAGSRDGLTARFLKGDEWDGADGTRVRQDRTFDPLSGRLTIATTLTRRRRVERRLHRIRLYTATEMGRALADADLQLEAAFSGFSDRPLDRAAHEMLLVARRR